MGILKRLVIWYGTAWWLQPVVSLVLFVLLICFSMVSMQSFCGQLAERLAGICFLALVVHLTASFIIGIAMLFRSKVLCGVVFCGQSVLFSGATILFALFYSLLFMFCGVDHFADNLKLPEGVELQEPLEKRALELLAEMPSKKDASVNLSNINWTELLEAVENGKEIDEPCRLPSLEKLMETAEGERRLMDYLAASPFWTVHEHDVDGIYAHRNMADDKNGFELRDFHSTFPNTPRAQFSFKIYFSGLPDRNFAKGVKDNDCKPYSGNGKNGLWTQDTWLKAGKAWVYIHEQSEKPGRRMTQRLLELVDEELSSLDMEGLGKSLPQEITLIGGNEGGMYMMDIWCNPGESGTLSVTATEITKGTKLSQHELSKEKIRTYGAPDGLVYFSSIGFTIFEGNWEQYYGAHFELWFKPDGATPKRKLWEGDYKIQGWQR